VTGQDLLHDRAHLRQTRAANAEVQVHGTRPTILVGARTYRESFSRGASPPTGVHHRVLRTRSFHVWNNVTSAC
jgi:hypothetical protein